jgi:hypothetical protein
MENKQTALDWLINEISYKDDGETYCSFVEHTDLSVYFALAKEMEKEQIIKAYLSGEIGEIYELKNTLTAKQYYENNYEKTI